MNVADEIRTLRKICNELTKLVLDIRKGGGGGGGESNTASNYGVGGVGLYHSKSGVDLRFKNINAGSSKVTITNDVPNREVDIDVAVANLLHELLSVTHSDTAAGAVVRGDVVTGQGAPAKWTRLAKGTAGHLLGYDPNDVVAINPNTLDVDKVDGHNITVSDSGPSGGDNGDIWLEY